MELLSAALKFNPKIKDISINNSEFLISHWVSQYADDSTLSLAVDENSLNEALNMISLFSICSGLRANFDKTQVVWIGARRCCGLELKTNTDIEWNHSGSFKLLGIQYSLAKDDRYIDNYYSKLEKIKKLLNDWSLRNISLLGKITVIKTLALPILVQCFTVLPNPLDHIIKSLQNIFYIFIWNGKTDQIKRSTLICDYSNGGLKMPHIQSFIHALKVSHTC